MDDLGTMTYIQSYTAILNAKIAGMVAENDFSKIRGDYPVYLKDNFDMTVSEYEAKIHELINGVP